MQDKLEREFWKAYDRIKHPGNRTAVVVVDPMQAITPKLNRYEFVPLLLQDVTHLVDIAA